MYLQINKDIIVENAFTEIEYAKFIAENPDNNYLWIECEARLHGRIVNVDGSINPKYKIDYSTNSMKIKTQKEMHEDGTCIVDEAYVKFDENGNAVEKTIEERFLDENISLDEYRSYKMDISRNVRDKIISSSSWVIERHSDEVHLVKTGRRKSTTLSEEEFNKWLEYRQCLRDLPETIDIDNYTVSDVKNPESEVYPESPVLINNI